MAFGLGFVQGLATSTDEALKTHIKDNKDRFDKNLEAALSRNLERSTRYDKDTRDAQEALELMAGLTDGDLGKATAAIQGLGGYKQVQGFVDAFRKGQQTDSTLTFDEAVNFVHGEVPEITHQQAINQLVKPLEFSIPKAGTKPKNWYQKLTADPRSMAAQIPKIMRERGIAPTQVDNLLKVQNAEINYNAIATPEQRFALSSAQLKNQSQEVQLDTARQALRSSTMNNKILAERVRYAPESERLKHEELALAVKTKAFNYETARRYDRKTLEIGYAVQEATLLEKRSGSDYEENLARIDTQIHTDQRRLAELTASEQTESDEFKRLQAQHDATVDHRVKVAKMARQFGANTSMYSKINPVSWHRSILRNNLTANGIGYEQGVDGTIKIKLEGQGPEVHKAYTQTFEQLSAASKDDPYMSRIVQTAFDQMIDSEKTIVEKRIEQVKNNKARGTTDAQKEAVNLYETITGRDGKESFVANADGTKKINPKIKMGDLVIINSVGDMESRRLQGYKSNIGVFMSPKRKNKTDTSPYIIGFRHKENHPSYKRVYGR